MPWLRVVVVMLLVLLGLASLGLVLPASRSGPLSKVLRLPAYGVMVYVAAAVATWRFVTGRQVEQWGHRRLDTPLPATTVDRTEEP